MLKQVNEIFGCFRWKHVLLTTKFSRTHPGKLHYLHFLVFNNHTKSLYVVQFWQLAWKLSILLPPFLSNSWHWQNGVAEEGGGGLIFPPHIFCPFPHQESHSLPLSLLKHANTLHDVLYLENMLIYMQRLCKIKQKNPSQEAILSIKGLSRLTEFCCSLLCVCPRWLWKAHHVSVSS